MIKTKKISPDKYPELTGLGLEPHQAKKIYVYATQAFPATYRYENMLDVPLADHGETVKDWPDSGATAPSGNWESSEGLSPDRKTRQ